MLAIHLRTPVKIELEPHENESPAVALLEREFSEPRVNGLTRSQIIDRILSVNRTAQTEFLDCFSIEQLSVYLQHLNTTSQPRGNQSRWVRPLGSRGISWSIRRF